MEEEVFFTLKRSKHESYKGKKTYFFRHPKGHIFPAEGKEADALQRSRNATGKPFELLGVSDGSTYQKELTEAIKRQDKALRDLTDFLIDGGSRSEWRRRRQAIADRAQKDLEDARMAEQEAAMGNIEAIPDTQGIFEKGTEAFKDEIKQMMS